MKKNIIITGANGYVGAMLINELLQNPETNIVIGIDKDSDDLLLNQILQEKSNFYFINQNLDNKDSDTRQILKLSWQDQVLQICKDNNINIEDFVIVHTAWQIREIYGDRQKSWDWNVIASQNVFDFAFIHNIERVIYFSTVASYGAFKDNTKEYLFTEKDHFRKTKYLYAEEKRITEENLLKTFYLWLSGNKNKRDILILDISQFEKETDKRDIILDQAEDFIYNHNNNNKKDQNFKTEVVIFRPAAITGPRGRFGRIRFGLQSALSGTLKQNKSIIYDIISMMTAFVPVTKNWLRQFIHEDDVANLVSLAIFNSNKSLKLHQYEVYNISPLGQCVLKHDMAKAVNKKMLRISPYLIRIAFFVFWHLTRGKVPTAEGSWKGYSYPIAVSGQKTVDNYKYKYLFNSKEAFVTKDGRYSFYAIGK